METFAFKARLELIGINPFVFVPKEILEMVFLQAKKDKSPIRVKGSVNGNEYRQTLVRYSGEWRLYINLEMLERSTKRIGEIIDVSIGFDPEIRMIEPHPKLVSALNQNKGAKMIFDGLTPSLRQEIIRYISFLKSDKSVEKNVERAIRFLLGKERFIGRDKP
ncbi:DUF1905 domain-containing protein [Belliella marina]|uniref:DUF1905 domain-containing protein n=1 Tax=Belliella marina TaxID=1644146 RepID=A0ABW4VMX6_9BACT